MASKSFEEWWDATSDSTIKLDKDSAEQVWQAAQQQYQHRLQRTESLYKTLPVGEWTEGVFGGTRVSERFVISDGQMGLQGILR